ncbi:MAG TPA: hypothetical protein VF134_02990 [Candidatus Dormibacteraeota bacterium]
MARLSAALLVGLLLTACGGPPADYQVASGSLSGSRAAGIVAWYGTATKSFQVEEFASGMTGMMGQIEVQGPLHLVCAGTFIGARPDGGWLFDVFLSEPQKEERQLRQLPVLDFGALRFPKGRYSVSLTQPAPNSPIKVSLDSTVDEGPDAFTGIYFNPGCLARADSAAQRRDLVGRDLAALAKVVAQLPGGSFKTAAGAAIDSTAIDFARGDSAAAASDQDALLALTAAQPPSSSKDVISQLATECAGLIRQSFPGA